MDHAHISMEITTWTEIAFITCSSFIAFCKVIILDNIYSLDRMQLVYISHLIIFKDNTLHFIIAFSLKRSVPLLSMFQKYVLTSVCMLHVMIS